MSKIFLEQHLVNLKNRFESIKFRYEQQDGCYDPFKDGVLQGIEKCINEIEKRLEEI